MKKLIQDYNLGKTITDISLTYNISRPTVRKILKNNNIYGKRKIEPNFRKYSCNENYFKKINNSTKAYWLGFIAADGYIRKDNKRLTIELHKKDISQLKKFSNNIKSNHPIKEKLIKNHYNKNTSLKKDYYHHCILQIWSPIMVEYIKKYGITNNKSLTMKFPTKIPDQFINNFMLGYFDGDGCWSISKNRQLLFRVIGNYSFLNIYQNILMNKCNLKKTKFYPEGKAYTIQYGGNKQCKRIYNYLYNNSNISLQRKKDKVNSVLLK